MSKRRDRDHSEKSAYLGSLAGCSLIYLPAALSKFMNHVRIFHNTAINYIPMVYERFYQNFYDNRQRITPM